MVCYAEKQGKPFRSSSLGQMVQFDTIIFCRTFKNYFGQFVWIEKQAGTGPSRRHIQGSKIAKGHQSVKVFSSTALKYFLKKVSQRRKKIERGPFGIFLCPVCRKTQKN